MTRRAFGRTAAVATGTALLLAAAAVGLGAYASSDASPGRPSDSSGTDVPSSGDTLAQAIAVLQQGLRANPDDAQSLATLGLDYVQQAKVTVNPSYYPKADGVLASSLRLQPTDNFIADAGEAALAAARHDFRAAQSWAQKGLAIDPYNPTLYGALDDADTQLGEYDAAFAAVQKMLDVRPGTPAFTRAEYVFELRGQLPQARQAMQQALQDAPSTADQAFAHYYLAELDTGNGNPAAALAEIAKGFAADPSYAALLEGRAKAEAALGQTSAALADYATLVGRVPQPEYVVEYGELLQSLGRTADANTQYQVFLAEEKLFESNGVALDTDPTLFYADHGNPTLAMHYAQQGIKIRPFLEMQDAYAWALHANHRDADALGYERAAMALGTRNALFSYHLGMIEMALGDKGAARQALTTALATNPHFNPLQAPTAVRTLASLGGAV